MKVVVVGLGTQGKKRSAVAGAELFCTVDPINPAAKYKSLMDVPLSEYDAALVCTPEDVKVELITYLLNNGKHVLVEKPLLAKSVSILLELKALAEKNKLTLYTAYNHRFEPHFANLKKVIDSGELGQIYLANFFYGNGTARDVRNSVWRDQGSGVLTDLGSHMLDTIYFMFGGKVDQFEQKSFNHFENKAFDHIVFGTPASYAGMHPDLPCFTVEASMLSWKNTFRLDVFAEHATAHIDCLCKWGPSTMTIRRRVLPSGVPPEEAHVLKCADPTWQLEYDYFKKMTAEGKNNTDADIWILKTLSHLQGKQI